MLFFEFTCVQIDAIFRVNPVAMLVQQPVNSVERATLLIGGQRKNQVAVRQIAFFFHSLGPATWKSFSAKPASSKRPASASAAAVTLPTESVVLISTSCLKISRANCFV